MSMEDRGAAGMTELVERVAEKVIGPAWATANLFQRYRFKEMVLPLLAATVSILDDEPHKARRGDEVEAWIKAARDEYTEDPDMEGPWDALDNLLDDYRLAADTGRPLNDDEEQV